MRQWVLSFPFQLRKLFASRPDVMGRVLGIVYRTITTHLVKKSGFTKTCVEYGGAVKVIACIEDLVVIKKILTHLKAPINRICPVAGSPGTTAIRLVRYQAFNLNCCTWRKQQAICWPVDKNWLEMNVKQENIQARATEFSRICCDQGEKRRT